MAKHVIYVPGLGDNKPHGQNIVIQLFRIFGITPHYLALGWNKSEGYDTKQTRLIAKINSLAKAGNSVSLIGVSAGASVVLNSFAANKNISKVICISGKINNPQTISNKTFKENPDFKESMAHVQSSVASLNEKQLKNIMSTHPRSDQVVPIADTNIKGATEKTLPGHSHSTGIFFAITIGLPAIAKFINSKK